MNPLSAPPVRARSLMLRTGFAALLLAFSAWALALHPKDFQSAEAEQRYNALAEELRCVMCQNESLAESPAGVADDMRLQLLALVHEGKSDIEIRDWFVARYGNFVLYRPDLSPLTWALWFGPFVLLLIGAGVLVAVVRRQLPHAPAVPPAIERKEG